MTAPRVDVASLALDSSGIAQAMNEFNQAMMKFQQAVDAAGQHAQQSSASIDKIAISAKDAGAAAQEHLAAARQEAEKGDEVFRRFADGVKEYAVSFLTFEAVKGMLENVVDTLVEAEYADARLNAVLKATGGVAGQTASSIEEMSKKLEGSSIFGSTEIKAAATRLLTFDAVRGPVFDRAMKDAVNLASLMGGDLPRATMVLGRSLESPAAGFMMLRQAGIVFTTAEKDQLRVMEAHNQILDAQTLILKKVEGASHGAAEAIRDTLGGAFAALKNNISDSIEQLKQSDGPLRRFVEGLALLAKPAGSPLEAAQSRIDLVKFGIANAAANAGMAPGELERRLRAGDTSLFGGYGLGRLLPGQHFPISMAEFAFMRSQLSNIAPDEALVNAMRVPGATVTPGGAAAGVPPGSAGAPLSAPLILSQEQQNALRSLIDSEKEEILTLKGDTTALEALKTERALHAGEIQHATMAEYAYVTSLLKEAQTHAAVAGVLQKMNADSRAQIGYRGGLQGDLTNPQNVQRLQSAFDQLADSTKQFYEHAKLDPGSVSAAQQEIVALKTQIATVRGVDAEQIKWNEDAGKGTAAQRAMTQALRDQFLAVRDGAKYWDMVDQLASESLAEEQKRFKLLQQGVSDFQSSIARVFNDGLSGQAGTFRDFTVELLQSWEQMLNKMVADWVAAQTTMGLLQGGAALGIPGLASIAIGMITANAPDTVGSKLPNGIPPTPPVSVIPSSSRFSAGAAGQTVIVQAPVHFTVAAIDSASFQDTLTQHAATIQTIVVSGVQRSRRMASALGVAR